MKEYKDRHDGRPIKCNNVEIQRAGTEAEDVGNERPTANYLLVRLHHKFLLITLSSFLAIEDERSQ